MHNWYGIETEAAFRRREWERAAEADARSSALRATRRGFPLLKLPHISLAQLRALSAPRLPLTTTLESRCRAATCI
jgi:hypothetical protein